MSDPRRGGLIETGPSATGLSAPQSGAAVGGGSDGKELCLETFLPYRLNRAAAALSAELSRIYRRDHGLTVPEWRVLATLGQVAEATASGIGRHSAMHKTKVSRAVRALERRRWLVRRTEPTDRRIEHLSLTRAGIAAYSDLAPQMLSFEAGLLARMERSERDAVLGGIAALEAALGLGGPGRAANAGAD